MRSPDTRDRDSRGFALPLVFLVLLLMAVAFVGLGDTVVVAAHSSPSRATAQRMFYACEGVARLAVGLTREVTLDDPDIADGDLGVLLEPIQRVAVENGIDLSLPTRMPEETSVIDEGALQGLEVLSNKMSFGAFSQSGNGCNINISQPLGKISPLQFLAFSVEGGHIEPGTNVNALDPDFTWGRQHLVVPGSLRIENTDETSAPLRLAAPAGGELFTSSPRTRTFRSYIQVPLTDNPRSLPERASSRFAYQADIRIIDGEWYLRDITNPTAWPGVPVFGDHPCNNHGNPEKTCSAAFTNRTRRPLGHYDNPNSPLRRLYSAYERIESGILVNPGPPKGVVSYGKLSGFQPGVTAGASCPGNPDELRGVSQCPASSMATATVEGAREAFADPLSGDAILPINIDVGLLGQALATLVNDEIGQHVCTRGTACSREFNGMIYVTSTKGAPPTLGAGAFPYALCGGNGGGGDASIDKGTSGGIFQPCASAVRYNAVRLYNASNLSAFVHSGLTVATDLPVYVQGDWNRSMGAGVRTLVMGDRVTVLTGNFEDDGTGSSGGFVDFSGSILAGWAAGTGVNKFNDFVRTVESNVNLRVTGSLVGGFSSSSVGRGQSGARINHWTHPFPLNRPTVDAQPPGVPRVSLGLPPELTNTGFF